MAQQQIGAPSKTRNKSRRYGYLVGARLGTPDGGCGLLEGRTLQNIGVQDGR